MDTILHMPGPQFLAFYTVFAIVVTFLCAAWARRCDEARPAHLPSVPDWRSDPYEVAWLQGGAERVLVTALFTLLQRGALAVGDPQSGTRADHVYKVPGGPAPNGAIEAFVYERLRGGNSVAILMHDKDLLAGVERLCTSFEARYTSAGLVTTPNERRRAFATLWVGLAAVLGLAATKIYVAISTGHTNVLFLVLLAILFTIVIPVVCKPGRLNARGRAYAKSISTAYAATRTGSGLSATADAGALPLYVALAGVPVLAGTEYAPFQRAVAPVSSSSSSSSCGGGDSGGSDGGGGGCGGGGCGGCGGS